MSQYTDILARVVTDFSSECWLWNGHVTGKGSYGTVRTPTRAGEFVHRIAYRARYGEVPAGTELDHTCKVRIYYNPDHVEPVTHLENVRRGQLLQRTSTHCANGHSFSEFPPYYTKQGYLLCRRCRTLGNRRSTH